MDGGINWTSSFVDYGIVPFNQISFYNDTIGAAVEYDGYIWGTEDGGENWYMINDGGLWSYFYSVDYEPDGNLLYAAYTDVFSMIDIWIGGTDFSNDDDDIGYLFDVRAFEDSRIYAVGEEGKVVSSNDGGVLFTIDDISSTTLNVVDGFSTVYTFGKNGKGFKLPFVCFTSSIFTTTVDYLQHSSTISR